MENKGPNGSEDDFITGIIGLLMSDRETTCLLSGPRFDEGGGNFTGGNGRFSTVNQAE